MLMKAVILIGAALALVSFVARAVRGSTGTAPKDTKPKRLPPRDLVQCSTCGIYLPAGDTCDCANRA